MMNRKWLLLPVLTLSMSGLLAACGGSEEAAPAPAGGNSAAPGELGGKLKVLTHRTDLVNNGTMDQYAEAFKKKYPKAELEFEGLTNYATDIKVRMTTGEAGDVLMIDPSIAQAELGKFFAELPSSMYDGVYFPDQMAFEGKRYGISTGVNTQGIVYNKQAFKKAGIEKVPTTLDELYAAAQKLKDAGIIPLYMNYGAQWPIVSWGENSTWYVSGDAKYHDKMITQEAPFTLESPWGTLLTIARTFTQKGYVEKDLSTNNWELSKGEVASGKAAMYFLGNWVIPQIIGAGAKSEDIGFFPLPYDNSGKSNAPLSSDYFIGVSKDSKNKELAAKWVEFFVKESGYVDASGFMPVVKSVEPKIAQLTEFKSFNPTFIEAVPGDSKFNEIANKAEIPLFTGKHLQDLIISKDLKASFDELNKKWAAAKKALGY